MEIILANPRGFCAGVNMAIECLERALEFFGPPLYVYHEIVHNKFVVEQFRRLRHGLRRVARRGARRLAPRSTAPTASRPRSATRPAGASSWPSTPPARWSSRSISRPSSTPREGYTIILIGHEGHDEVIGTMGEAPDQMVLVETAEDVERLVVPDPAQGRLSDADDAQRRRCQHRHRRAAQEVPPDRQSAQG